MAHNRLCIYIIHYVQFIILGENPGIWKLWTDYGHYELPEPLMVPRPLQPRSLGHNPLSVERGGSQMSLLASGCYPCGAYVLRRAAEQRLQDQKAEYHILPRLGLKPEMFQYH